MNKQISVNNVSVFKRWLVVGSLLCMLSVIIGAFAAHGLKQSLSEYQLGIVDTGAKYQMYHGFAILITSVIFFVMPLTTKIVNRVNTIFSLGCLLFSGSLYFLALTEVKYFAYFTPLGGVFFILGWLLLLWSFYSKPALTKSRH